MQTQIDFTKVAFNGSNVSAQMDGKRLGDQLQRIFDLMKDGKWRTLKEIESITGDCTSSVSAQLRNLKKEKFGNHAVPKQPRGKRINGLWEYKLIVNKNW